MLSFDPGECAISSPHVADYTSAVSVLLASLAKRASSRGRSSRFIAVPGMCAIGQHPDLERMVAVVEIAHDDERVDGITIQCDVWNGEYHLAGIGESDFQVVGSGGHH